MELSLKIMIVVSVVGMLHSSERFRSMSREMDESVILTLRRIMRTAEESGFPAEVIPVLMLLTALMFMFSMALKVPGGH